METLQNTAKAADADETPNPNDTAPGRRFPKDPFCVEKNLHAWASSRVISRARDYYRNGRVLTLDCGEEGKIAAQVEGTGEEPYRVEIAFGPSGFPVASCSCPFDWELLCKHAVAVLLAWQQEETGSEPALGPETPAPQAEDPAERARHLRELEAIEREERRARCAEQGLRVLKTPTPGPLGAYDVGSADPARRGQAYRVVVRDEQWRHASCGCLDFSTNELGACKHVELVKKYLGKEGGRRLSRACARSRRLWVYLKPRESQGKLFEVSEEICFYAAPGLRRLPSWLASELDAAGYLQGGGAGQKARLEKLLRRLRSEGLSVEADPPLLRALDARQEALRWERSISELAAAPSRHPAWRASVEKLGVRLHPYQKEGILFAVKKRRAFIGDDMGLGKTMQAIGAALLLKELGQVRRVLVVCPASLKHQWQAEIERVTSVSAAIVSGGARARAEQYRTTKGFFILVNYELLYRDLDAIRALGPDLIVLDEAQRIKNWEAKISRTLKRLESPFKLVLTGTPLENRLAELLSIAEFLEPRALGAPWKLIPTYARLDADDKIVGYARLDHLRERLGKFLIRRTRPEVLAQLPKRTDNNFWTPITPAQQEVHDELSRQVMRVMQKWQRFKRLTREDLQRLFTLLGSMRIVCNAYGQYDWKPLEREVLASRRVSESLKKKIGSPKLDEFRRVMSDLLENPGQKVVVFSSWERMIRLADLYIRDLLDASKSRSIVFSGKLSLKQRAAEVRRFLEDPAARVFFSTDAGSVGLNLQHAANCVVNLEIPWNPAVLEQRIGRVYRMGQKKSVQVVNLISSECVEERIFNLVAQKKALFSGVFDPATKDIRFDPNQTASFMDKMKQLVPAGAAAAAGEDAHAGPDHPAEAVSDSVADAAAKNGELAAAAAAEVDLGPAVAALAGLLGAPPMERAPAGGMKLRMSQDAEGVHLSLPTPAAELLRGFKPLLQALLAIGFREAS